MSVNVSIPFQERIVVSTDRQEKAFEFDRYVQQFAHVLVLLYMFEQTTLFPSRLCGNF